MISNLLTSAFWFDLAFAGLTRFDKAVLILSALLVVVSVALAIFRRGIKNKFLKRYMRSWTSMLATIGIFGLIWAALRYEEIQVFSTRFAVLILYIIGLIWGVYLVRYYFKKYRLEVMEYIKEQERKKYM